MPFNESDTRSKLIDPKIKAVGWQEIQIQREYKVTDGRVMFDGKKGIRQKPKYADYLLRYKSSIPIAVVEAKKEELSHLEGVRQAKEYAQKIGVRFAYATNGHEIEFMDLLHNFQETVEEFHTPEELWEMYKSDLRLENQNWIQALLQEYFVESGIGNKRSLRYYQEKAVNKTIEAVISGKKRVLINMATGTGKTFTSVQMIYKLLKSRVVKKILFIVDRNILADQAFKDFDAAMDKGACWRLSPKEETFNTSRDAYFGIYQTLVGTEDDEEQPTKGRKDRFKEFPPDFFDLILIDECHRGGASEGSQWYRLLEYFNSAIQIGLTATPKRTDSVNTYNYFGEPITTYSLKEGINDGFLAPYIVKRVRTNIDANGYRPQGVQYDVRGQQLENRLYEMKDFERKLSFPSRTRAFAYHLVAHLLKTDLFGKTIVFCVDQRHAADMAKYINEAYKYYVNQKGLPEIKDFAVRITGADQASNGKYPDLEKFQNLENPTPVVVTTSKLLTTGVDVKNIKNVVIFANIGSMTEFKQIIGRGTRLYDTGNELTEKLGFTILEYGNNSTELFYDPDFDGDAEFTENDGDIDIDDEGEDKDTEEDRNWERKKKIVDDGEFDTREKQIRYRLSSNFMRDQVQMAAETLSLLGPDGKTLSPQEFTRYHCRQIRTIYTDAEAFKQAWTNPKSRKELFDKIENIGIKVDTLAELFCIENNRKDIDLFDIIMNLAFGYKFKSKSDRIKELKKQHKEFFGNYTQQALEVLDVLLKVYEMESYKPIKITPDVFKTSHFQELNISTLQDVQEVFGSKTNMLTAFQFLQTYLYEGVVS